MCSEAVYWSVMVRKTREHFGLESAGRGTGIRGDRDMPDTQNMPPEHWDARDHIVNIKRGLNKTQTCEFHDDSARADIWLVRHVDDQGKKQDTILREIRKNGGGKEKWKVKLGPLEICADNVRDVSRVAAIIVGGVVIYYLMIQHKEIQRDRGILDKIRPVVEAYESLAGV